MSIRMLFVAALSLAAALGTTPVRAGGETGGGFCNCPGGGTARVYDVNGCKNPVVLKRVCERNGLGGTTNPKPKPH